MSARDAPETFLGGRVIARQPAVGYRAAIDTVLLGASIFAGKGEKVIELGCGSGAGLLIAAHRNVEASFVGVERDEALAALAAENAQANPSASRVRIVAGDALVIPPDQREQFDQAFLNPPYQDDPDAGRPPADPARRAAFVNEQGVEVWVKAALSLVPTRGRVTLIHRADRLADILTAFGDAAGEIRLRPIHTKADAPARRILVRARKGSRTPLALLPPLVLHDEGGGWSAGASAILEGRAGLAL
jgi:tRNA1(Val) A37 N6-methylase TrmN6